MISKAMKKYSEMSMPIKASLWYMICGMLQKGIGVITTPIFTRIMTTDEYGIVTIYNSWETLITVFATLNLTSAVFNNAMSKYEDRRDEYTSVMQVFTIGLSSAIFCLYFISRAIWNPLLEMNTRLVLYMFIDIVVVSAMSFWTARNRYEFRYKASCLVTVIGSIMTPIFSYIFICFASNDKGEAKILGSVIAHVLIYGVVLFLNIHKGKVKYDKDFIIYSIKFNVPLIPHYLSQNILSQADRVMIGKMCSMASAGIYGVAYQVGLLMNIITGAINASFVPLLYEGIKKREYATLDKFARMILLGCGTICFWFSLFAPEIMKIMAPIKYYDAIWIIPPVAMSSLFIMLYSFFANVNFYFEKSIFVMIASVCTAGLNIFLNYIFIKKYGYLAAGYTTLICYIVYSFAQYLFMLRTCKNKQIDNPYNAKILWSIALIFAALSIASSFLYKLFLVRYLVIIALTIILVIFSVKKRSEIMLFFSKK